jgi:hypothetical protein
MPFNPECTSFNGEICLSRTSTPYRTICSGTTFNNRGLDAQRIAPPVFECIDAIWGDPLTTNVPWEDYVNIWNADPCVIRDFMEERTPGILDSDLCAIHPLANIEYEVQSCLNNRGWAILQEVGNPTDTIKKFDESCVGYKTAGPGGTELDHIWVTASEGFFKGSATPNPSIPVGPCVGTEAVRRYTLPADASNCGNFSPCFELRTVTCQLDTSTPSPIDPECPTGVELPPSLLQQNFFCSTDAVISANQGRNRFCSTDRNDIAGNVATSVRFCSVDNNFGPIIQRVSFCPTDVSDFRREIPSVQFCEFRDELIRETVLVQEVQFCEMDRDELLPVIPSVEFCSTNKPVPSLRFCSFDDSNIRNLNPVQFCETDDTVLRPAIPSAAFCSQDQVLTVLFCSTQRKDLDGIPEVQFCETPRREIDGTGDATFCSANELLIRRNALFCSIDRRTIDGVPEVNFCSTSRQEIDGAIDVQFCETDRSSI